MFSINYYSFLINCLFATLYKKHDQKLNSRKIKMSVEI